MSIYKEYREAKEQLKECKLIVDRLAEEIKMQMGNNSKVEEDSFILEKRIRVKSKLDSMRLLKKLQEMGRDDLLINVIKVDEDLVLNAVDEGTLDIGVVEECASSKEITSLHIVKKRGQDNDNF